MASGRKGKEKAMNIHRAKGGRLFGAAMLVLLFTASAANAWGGNGCVPFKATLMGSYYSDRGWVSDVYFTIGGDLLYGQMVTSIDTTKKITVNNFLGSETGVVTTLDGSTFVLVSHFAAPHQASASGVAMINESGTIGNGTGTFSGISGHFTDHGIYGSVVPPPPQTSTGPWAWFVGGMEGNICGVAVSSLTAPKK